jgi:hypothetical protein
MHHRQCRGYCKKYQFLSGYSRAAALSNDGKPELVVANFTPMAGRIMSELTPEVSRE